jgi:hypothetical protein
MSFVHVAQMSFKSRVLAVIWIQEGMVRAKGNNPLCVICLTCV